MPQRNDSPASSEATWIAFAIVSTMVILVLWFFYRAPIVYFAYALDWIQIKARQMTVGLNDRGLEYLAHIESVFNGRLSPSDVRWEDFSLTSAVVGSVMQMPIAVGMMGMAALVFFKMKGNGFKRKFSLVQYLEYQTHHWGTLRPSAKFEPNILEKNTMPSKTPTQWMHDLGLKVRLDQGGALPEDTRAVVEKEFIRQLGPGWGPVNRLKLHVRCLLAMFILHGIKDKSALSVRETIARTYVDVTDEKKRNEQLEALIAPILSDEKKCKPFLDMADKHAFIAPAMITLLKEVRKRQGVLASAEFLWLKKIDRDLWYAMNDTGRNAFHIESAGIVSHYNYERVARRPMPEPQVEAAIQGLEEYITHHDIHEED